MPVYADFSNRNGEPFMADSSRGREWLKNTRTLADEISSHVARADSSAADAHGLKMTTRFDESGRPIREFSNTGDRKLWMLPYMGVAHEMLRICKEPQTPAQNAAFEARRVSDADLASGNFTLPEIG